MKVYDLLSFKGQIVVCGISLWIDNIKHHKNQVLTCGEKQWKIIDFSRMHPGCFAEPKERRHMLIVEPIKHNTYPIKGDILV